MSKTFRYRYVPPPRVEITPGIEFYRWSVHARYQFLGLWLYHKFPEYRGEQAVEVLETNRGKVYTIYEKYRQPSLN